MQYYIDFGEIPFVTVMTQYFVNVLLNWYLLYLTNFFMAFAIFLGTRNKLA